MFSSCTHQPQTLREQLTSTDTRLNNIQTKIDELRAMHPHNPTVQTNLDLSQEQLDRARDMQVLAYGQIENSENIQKFLQK